MVDLPIVRTPSRATFELATLAAAHAELGDLDMAVDWQTEAVEAAPKAQKDQYQQRLKRYQTKMPYRIE